MTRDQFFKFHEQTLSKASTLMQMKNEDYCKDGPFQNLELCEKMGICSSENGILVRISDKISRLVSILAKGISVKTESVEDTCLDVINYSVLLHAIHSNRSNKGLFVKGFSLKGELADSTKLKPIS